MRSAIVIAIPEASPTVDDWLERTCPARPSIGVPAHVTLLFPFVPAEELDAALLEELGELFAATSRFEAAFRTAARFPGTLYLVPEPPDPFIALTQEIVRRYPDHPPFEGEFEAIIPHLTVAQGEETVLDEAEHDILPALPIQSAVREALLLEELEPNWGRWETRARLPLRR